MPSTFLSTENVLPNAGHSAVADAERDLCATPVDVIQNDVVVRAAPVFIGSMDEVIPGDSRRPAISIPTDVANDGVLMRGTKIAIRRVNELVAIDACRPL